MYDILIVDDEKSITELVVEILSEKGYNAIAVNSAQAAIEAVINNSFSTVLLDIWLEDSEVDGIDVLKSIKQINADLPVIMISGHGNIETAIETTKLGAYDFIEKPFNTEKMMLIIKRAITSYLLITENNSLKTQWGISIFEICNQSKAFQSLVKNALNVAATNSRILIIGENGTGKESLARFIHQNSQRKERNFYTLPAIMLNDENFDREFLGDTNKIGILQRCNNGTLYIKEIADLNLRLQARLLNLLQDLKQDVRLIVGSSMDLKAAIGKGTFNQGLYYRISVVPLYITPLRNRKSDIAILVEYFLQFLAETIKTEKLTLSPAALAALELYPWNGNIMELRNVCEWLVIMKSKESNVIEANDLPAHILLHKTSSNDNEWLIEAFSKNLKEARDIFEKYYITQQLDKDEGNISKAAERIGMNRAALHKKIKTLNLLPHKKSAP